MDMDKELALIFDYAAAPENLKAAASNHRENCLALINAKAQAKQAQENLEACQSAYQGSNQSFREALKSWTPVVPGGGE